MELFKLHFGDDLGYFIYALIIY